MKAPPRNRANSQCRRESFDGPGVAIQLNFIGTIDLKLLVSPPNSSFGSGALLWPKPDLPFGLHVAPALPIHSNHPVTTP